MTARLNPYLHFSGEAAEAMSFYQSVFGGEVTSMTFRELGGMGMPEDEQDKVMHSQLDVEGVLTLMGADTPSSMEQADSMQGITVSLSGDDEATLRGWWDALAEGAAINVPLEKAPWGDWYGDLKDRYGVPWLVNITGSGQAG